MSVAKLVNFNGVSENVRPRYCTNFLAKHTDFPCNNILSSVCRGKF